jgi:acyl dehydratase
VPPASSRPPDARSNWQPTVRIAPPAANGAVHAALATRRRRTAPSCSPAAAPTWWCADGGAAGPAAGAAEAPALPPIAGWQLSGASGRAYAALSGDWNPIHLWPWTARLMGLQAPIIHGMHTLGRACAELERAGGRPLARLDGRFRAPIELGSAVALAAGLADGHYRVGTGGRIAVEGGFDFDSAQAMQNAYPRS